MSGLAFLTTVEWTWRAPSQQWPGATHHRYDYRQFGGIGSWGVNVRPGYVLGNLGGAE